MPGATRWTRACPSTSKHDRRQALLGYTEHLDHQAFGEQFVSRLNQGDPEAEREFFSHFGTAIKIRLRATLRATELIEDIRQETLLRVLRRLRSGEPLDHPDRLAAFVHGVCTNVTRELQRKGERHPQLHEDAPEPESAAPGPDDEFADSERNKLVRKVLAGLSARDRMVLSLIYLDEVDRQEVCKRLNVGPSNLRVALHRARLQFRKALERQEK